MEIIAKEDIYNVITTSPPHSVQLIGLKLKTQLKNKINWIVDFRDPWTDIYYYTLLQNSKFSHNKSLKLERQVVEQRSEERRVGKSVDLGSGRIIKKKK